MFIETITGIILILIIVDIYLRVQNNTRFIAFLMISNDIVNKTLANKEILTKEELDRARKEILDNLKNVNPKNYKAYKKALLKMGINIEK
jgi:ligand-binding sensor protein